MIMKTLTLQVPGVTQSSQLSEPAVAGRCSRNTGWFLVPMEKNLFFTRLTTENYWLCRNMHRLKYLEVRGHNILGDQSQNNGYAVHLHGIYMKIL